MDYVEGLISKRSGSLLFDTCLQSIDPRRITKIAPCADCEKGAVVEWMKKNDGKLALLFPHMVDPAEQKKNKQEEIM